MQKSQIADKRKAGSSPSFHTGTNQWVLIKLLPGARGSMQACNYDFAHDNSHSSDVNVVSLWCEDNIFLMRFFLFILNKREISIYTRELPLPPTPTLAPVSVDLGGWQAWSCKRQVQRTRRITEGYGSPLNHFGGLSTSSTSSKNENKDSAAHNARLIRWRRSKGRSPRTFTRGQ